MILNLCLTIVRENHLILSPSIKFFSLFLFEFTLSIEGTIFRRPSLVWEAFASPSQSRVLILSFMWDLLQSKFGASVFGRSSDSKHYFGTDFFSPPLDSQFYFIYSIIRFNLFFSLTKLSSCFCFVLGILSSILVYFFWVINCRRVPSTLSVIQTGAEINNRLGIQFILK